MFFQTTLRHQFYLSRFYFFYSLWFSVPWAPSEFGSEQGDLGRHDSSTRIGGLHAKRVGGIGKLCFVAVLTGCWAACWTECWTVWRVDTSALPPIPWTPFFEPSRGPCQCARHFPRFPPAKPSGATEHRDRLQDKFVGGKIQTGQFLEKNVGGKNQTGKF